MPENFPVLQDIRYNVGNRTEPFVLAFVYFYCAAPGVVKGPCDSVNRYIKDVLVPDRGPCIVHYTAFRKGVKTITFNVFGLLPENIYGVYLQLVRSKPRIRVLVIPNERFGRPARPVFRPAEQPRMRVRGGLFGAVPQRPVHRNAIYDKTIREMPRGWFADFDPYVPAEWVEHKALLRENNQIVKEDRRGRNERAVRVVPDDVLDIAPDVEAVAHPIEDTPAVPNVEAENLAKNLQENKPFTTEKINEIIDFLN